MKLWTALILECRPRCIVRTFTLSHVASLDAPNTCLRVVQSNTPSLLEIRWNLNQRVFGGLNLLRTFLKVGDFQTVIAYWVQCNKGISLSVEWLLFNNYFALCVFYMIPHTVVFLVNSVSVVRITEDAVTSVLLTGTVAIFWNWGVVKLARGSW